MADDRSMELRLQYLESTLGLGRHSYHERHQSWEYGLDDILRRVDRLEKQNERRANALDNLMFALTVAVPPAVMIAVLLIALH